jgi:WD40 repeat protein
VCKPWRRELEARGFCGKTVQLCLELAGGGDAGRLQQNALRRLDASTDDAERALCLDGGAFMAKSEGWKRTLQEWLQAASQEPDASFLSRGAASTAQSLGLALVQWGCKPQGRYPGSYTLPGHSSIVNMVALSRDGTRAASGSQDKLVKIWDTETGAEVISLE